MRVKTALAQLELERHEVEPEVELKRAGPLCDEISAALKARVLIGPERLEVAL